VAQAIKTTDMLMNLDAFVGSLASSPQGLMSNALADVRDQGHGSVIKTFRSDGFGVMETSPTYRIQG
jgi:hypothetical protein